MEIYKYFSNLSSFGYRYHIMEKIIQKTILYQNLHFILFYSEYTGAHPTTIIVLCEVLIEIKTPSIEIGFE